MAAKKKQPTTGEGFEPLLTFQDLADKLGFSIEFIKKAKAQYGLPFFKIGASVRFRMSEVELWLKQRQGANLGA